MAELLFSNVQFLNFVVFYIIEEQIYFNKFSTQVCVNTNLTIPLRFIDFHFSPCIRNEHYSTVQSERSRESDRMTLNCQNKSQQAPERLLPSWETQCAYRHPTKPTWPEYSTLYLVLSNAAIVLHVLGSMQA